MVLSLLTVTRTQGSNQALKDGTVRPRTCRFDFVEVSPLVQAFRQMVRGLEFDVCEMAFTTYLCAREHGTPVTALPVFLVRGLHHGAIVRHREATVRDPKELEGTRVGVNRGYTVTTGVWARGILQDEYAVDLDRVTWVPSGDEHVADYRPPANVTPLPDGRNLADLLESGELAAAVGIPADRPGLAPLIDSPEAAAFTALRRDGLYPINHLVVVRDDLLDAHPELAVDIVAAFAEAKSCYLARLRAGDLAHPTAADHLHRRVMEIVDDPLPYGIAPNRHMIDKLVDHAVRQRILSRPPDVSTLFHPSTLDLVG
jgi:4,5-dihydroxyphthalate decarboxylase